MYFEPVEVVWKGWRKYQAMEAAVLLHASMETKAGTVRLQREPHLDQSRIVPAVSRNSTSSVAAVPRRWTATKASAQMVLSFVVAMCTLRKTINSRAPRGLSLSF